MNHDIPESDVLFRLLKLIIAQYLSTFHEFSSFQQQSLRALTTFLLRNALRLAEDVKRIITMQGRTEPNALHLLVAGELIGSVDLEKLLHFMIKRKEENRDMKSITVIEKLGKKVFENQSETLNKYPKDKQSANIRYVRPVYTVGCNMDKTMALPFHCPLDQCYPLPPEISYKATSQKVVGANKNVEYLIEYTRRQNKIAMMGVIRNEEAKREKEDQEEDAAKTVKKIKFDPISYL